MTKKEEEKLILSKNLKDMLKRHGKTYAELAHDLNYKESTVLNWIVAQNYPRIDRIQEMADYFGVYKSDLIEDKKEPPNISYVKDIVKVPILGTISCGDPITATENIEEYKERMADGLPKGDVFYLRCKGDSMSPVIPDQALVLCKVQPDVESGEIAAVLVNGDEEATLKRVRKLSGSILLEPENNAYEPILVNEENPARILGKACEVVYGL